MRDITNFYFWLNSNPGHRVLEATTLSFVAQMFGVGSSVHRVDWLVCTESIGLVGDDLKLRTINGSFLGPIKKKYGPSKASFYFWAE